MTDTTIDQIAAELSDYKRAYTTLLRQHKDRFIEISGLCEERDALKAVVNTAGDVLRHYEAWEADLILNGDWSNAGVQMNQENHDEMMAIQAERNAALDQIKALSASSDKR